MDFGTFHTRGFSLTVDVLTGGTLSIDGLIEGTTAIYSDAHVTAFFAIDILDATFSAVNYNDPRKQRKGVWKIKASHIPFLAR